MVASQSIFSTSLLSLLCAGATASALTMETVTIGDPGNSNDPATGGFYGGVSYTYNIGKYEVTLNQYTEFLNAVADTDTYALYRVHMATVLNSAGINRSGSSGSYNYTVIGDGQRPVTFVNWFAAARFCNWLHNGQPNTGSQTAGTTEQGAYALNGAIFDTGFSKSAGAKYWIPSASEWYKAAFYQPAANGGDADGYWQYATGTNDVPNSRNGSLSDPNSGNITRDDSIANGYNGGYAVTNSAIYESSQNYLTTVGAYALSDSYYGTFDQGGNVEEWTDEFTNFHGNARYLRGGAWNLPDGRSSGRSLSGSSDSYSFTGFRVATSEIPSPTIITLSPADNATGVALTSNLIATFSEAIAIGTGNITIKNVTDNTQTTIPITSGSPQITVSGSTLTINPTADLVGGKSYAIQIAATAIKDLSNNPFAGISDDTTWNFSTALPAFSSWITGTFAGGASIPVGKRGPLEDPDNDGISNLLEYALAGHDPTVANPSVGTFTGTTLSYTKRLGTTGLTFAIQRSTDLGATDPWTEVAGGTYVNNSSTISYTFTPGIPANQFLRLQVQSN
jgi:sulfatase modifying factor 1